MGMWLRIRSRACSNVACVRTACTRVHAMRASYAYREMRYQSKFPFWGSRSCALHAALQTVALSRSVSRAGSLFTLWVRAGVQRVWKVGVASSSFVRAAGVLNASIGCARAHVFAHAAQSTLERGMRANSSYARSRNCAHHGPTIKFGTKTCPRIGDTILARCTHRCKL